jgi:hypothetical protein
MANLRPFRDYDEKDVINLFAWSGAVPTNRGTVAKIQRGYLATDTNPVMLGAIAASYNNTVSQRWGAYAKIAAAGSGEAALGILLKDVRETDENGELLKFNPIKAAEMDVVLSGQAAPVVTKGTFLYSGTLLTGTIAPMTRLYVGAAGELSTAAVGNVFGMALGGVDTNGCILVKLDFSNTTPASGVYV